MPGKDDNRKEWVFPLLLVIVFLAVAAGLYECVIAPWSDAKGFFN